MLWARARALTAGAEAARTRGRGGEEGRSHPPTSVALTHASIVSGLDGFVLTHVSRGWGRGGDRAAMLEGEKALQLLLVNGLDRPHHLPPLPCPTPLIHMFKNNRHVPRRNRQAPRPPSITSEIDACVNATDVRGWLRCAMSDIGGVAGFYRRAIYYTHVLLLLS